MLEKMTRLVIIAFN
jgi:hypothetical protein